MSNKKRILLKHHDDTSNMVYSEEIVQRNILDLAVSE